MKIAIISDLHSNREALEAVFAHIQSLAISTVYCLGDVVGYGPEPEVCVDLVRGHTQLCLMGNHDEGLFRDASDFNPHARGGCSHSGDRAAGGRRRQVAGSFVDRRDGGAACHA